MSKRLSWHRWYRSKQKSNPSQSSLEKKGQKHLAKSFRIALSEIKELGVYPDTNARSALINKGKYVGQDTLTAIRICKALLKVTGVV